MSVSNLQTKETYLGSGSNDTFAIPFDYQDINQIQVILIPAGFLPILLVEGADFALDPPLDLMSDPQVWPENVILTAPLAVGNSLTIKRSTVMNQQSEYLNGAMFYPEVLEKDLDKSVMIDQELQASIDAAEDRLDAVGLTLADHESRITQNESDIASLQALGEGAVPAGGLEYSVLQKVSDDDGDADWTTPMVAKGFSERFNEIIDLEGLGEIIPYIMKMGYTQPNLSLGGSVSTALRERGDTISSVTLTANFTKTLDDLDELRFYLNPSTLLDTQAIGPGSGSANNVYSTPFSTTTTFRAEIDDVSAQPKPSRSATLTYSFVYPYYVGAGASGLNGAAIAGLTKLIINQNNNHAVNITASAGQVLYYAFPASYGDLTSILDPSSFEILGSFTKRTVSITGLDGNPVSYTVYEGNNPLAAGSYANTYKR